MKWQSLAKHVAHWTIPPGFQKILRPCVSANGSAAGSDPEKQAIISRNKRFLNRHKGKRCFVLATGPSIRGQDLRPLQNEWCIATSEFYKHQHYALIKPAYYVFGSHCRFFPPDAMLRQLGEMKRYSHGETVFFNYGDRGIVANSSLVSDCERLYYLGLEGDFTPSNIDLTSPLPVEGAVTLMATWIAIYMGFAEIYLVGCDHDRLWKWDGSRPYYAEHFYDGAPTEGYRPFDIDYELRVCLGHRLQYRWTNEVALRKDIKIINLNPHSYIDIFPKLSLTALFNS